MVIERIQNYKIFKDKNPALQVLGINCNRRNPLMPEVKTLKEQGFETPTIFFAVVANVKMSQEKRQELGSILETAQKTAGNDYLLESADLYAPQFRTPPVTVADFFVTRTSYIHYLTNRYKDQISEAKR